jgi:hypothetical protein
MPRMTASQLQQGLGECQPPKKDHFNIKVLFHVFDFLIINFETLIQATCVKLHILSPLATWIRYVWPLQPVPKNSSNVDDDQKISFHHIHAK